MKCARWILSLFVIAGILLCPFTCMGVACADAAARQSAVGCHCQKCRHKSGDRSQQPESPDDGHCCICVCDGALAKAADEEFPGIILLPSWDALAMPSLTATQSAAASAVPLRLTLASGKAVRIVLRSLVI